MTEPEEPAGRRILPTARFAGLLGLLVLVSLVVRVDALRNTAPDVPALGDAHAYHVLADNLAHGRGYLRPYDWEREGLQIATAEYPPGLPVVLAVADRAGASSETSQRAVLCVIGSLTVGLIGLIARRLGGDSAGYLAALVAALHPGLWNMDVSLGAEALAGLMGAAVVLAALAVADRPVWWRWLSLGLLAGAGALVRSEFILIGPALLVLVAWRTAGGGWKPGLARVGIGLGGIVLVLAPWTVRNAVAFGELVPLTNNSGSVARGANCDAAYHGEFKGLWVTDIHLDGVSGDARRAGCFSGFTIDAHQNEAQSAAALRADGLAYARHHLGDVPGVVAARVGRTVGLYRFDQQRNFAAAEGRNPTWDGRGTRTFQLLAVIGLAGLVAAAVQRRLPWERWLLVVAPAAALVTVALTYGNPRFRVVAEPSVVVLAVLAVMDLYRGVSASRAR